MKRSGVISVTTKFRTRCLLQTSRANIAHTRGEGARLNDSRIRVSAETDLAQALVGTGFSYEVDVRSFQAEVMTRVLRSVRDIRRPGSAALDLCSVACGRYIAANSVLHAKLSAVVLG